jgi:hypothetical protein
VVGGGGGGGVDPWGPDDNIEHMDADAFGHHGRSKRRIGKLSNPPDPRCDARTPTPNVPCNGGTGVVAQDGSCAAIPPSTIPIMTTPPVTPADPGAIDVASPSVTLGNWFCGASPGARIGRSTAWGAARGGFVGGPAGAVAGAQTGFLWGTARAFLCSAAGWYMP